MGCMGTSLRHALCCCRLLDSCAGAPAAALGTLVCCCPSAASPDALLPCCATQGDLVCCETCPAVYHADCAGLPGPPEGDFYCPRCRCSTCGAGGSGEPGCRQGDAALAQCACCSSAYSMAAIVSCGGCCMQAYVSADASLLCHHPWQPLSPPRLQTFAALSPPVSCAEGIVPTGCQWVDCQAFVGPDTLQQQPRPFAGTSSGGNGVKPEPAAAACEPAAAAGGPEPMQVDGAAAAGTADFSRIIAAASSKVLQGGVPAEASAAAPAAQAAALEAPGGAAVHCPVTGRWSHLDCFPAQFTEQLRHTAYTQPCISTQPAAESSERLAAVCAAGLLPLGSIAEGARAAGGSGAAEGGGSGSGFAPLPLSLLVVRGAAVAAPADCRGHCPAYAPEQRRQLQVALSAALQVLHRWAAPPVVQSACKQAMP